MRKILILFCFSLCCWGFNAKAQDTLDFKTVDFKTNTFYQNAQWDSLIAIGNSAIKAEIDYFYLRSRLGIAYYYKERYSDAAIHFEKARAFNSGDLIVLEYLYYSYKYSGREAKAQMLTRQFPEELKLKLKISDKFVMVKSIELNGTSVIDDNFKKNENLNSIGNKGKSGSGVLSGQTMFGNVGMKLQLGKKATLIQSFSMLSQENKAMFMGREFSPGGRIYSTRDTIIWKPSPPPGYYTYDTIIENRQAFNSVIAAEIKEFSLTQMQYYLNLNLTSEKGITFSPFVHLINVAYTKFNFKKENLMFHANDSIETHTQYHYPPFLGGAIVDTVFYTNTAYEVDISKYSITQKDTSFLNYCFGTSFEKRFGKTDVSLFGSFSNLNGLKQKQIGGSITYFPKGNLNLYYNLTTTLFAERKNKAAVVSALGGIKAANKLWIEGNATIGNMANFTEQNGMLVYNNFDKIKFRAGVSAFLVFNKLDIILRYGFFQKETIYYITNQENKFVEKTASYNAHLLSGGIKWKF